MPKATPTIKVTKPLAKTNIKTVENPPSENMLKPMLSNTFKSIAAFRPKSYAPILTVLLLIASFLLGVLITKIYYLENGQSTNNVVAAAGNTAPGNTAPTVGQKVDLGVGHLPGLGDSKA